MNIALLTGCLPNYAKLAERTIYANKAEYCRRHGYHLEVVTSIRSKFQDGQCHAGGFSWSRLEHMAEMVESGKWDWVWVLGCDTLITNMRKRAEAVIAMSQTAEAETKLLPVCPFFPHSAAPNPVINWKPINGHKRIGKKHLIVCGERVTAVQADSFMVRCTPEGSRYLRDILAHYPQYQRHPWVENQAMIDLRDKHAAITCIVPQHELNAYDYTCFTDIDPAYGEGKDCYGNRGQWMLGDLLIHWPGVTLARRMELLEEYEPMILR